MAARREWWERGGVTVITDSSYDVETGRAETHWTLLEDGRRHRAHSSIRLYTVRELRELFREEGFDGFRQFADYEGEPFELDARRLIFLASKSLS